MTVPADEENPFIVGPAPHEKFWGMTAKMKTIVQRFAQGSQSTGVIGEPRSGKTSLLLELPLSWEKMVSGADAQLLFSHVDASTLPEPRGQEFWVEALHPISNLPMTNPNSQTLTSRAEACRQNSYRPSSLDALFKELKTAQLRLVLIVDEFDQLLNDPTLIQHGFFATLRRLAGNTGACALVFGSTKDLITLNAAFLASGGSPMFNFVMEVVLQPLNKADVDEFLQGAQDRITDEERRWIGHITGGHFWLVQTAASTLWKSNLDAKNRERLKIVFNELVAQSNQVFKWRWEHWSASNRILMVFATLIELNALTLNDKLKADLKRFFQSYPDEIEALTKHGYILPNATTPTGYVVRPMVLLHWIAKHCAGRIAAQEPCEKWINPNLELLDERCRDLLRVTMGARLDMDRILHTIVVLCQARDRQAAK